MSILTSGMDKLGDRPTADAYKFKDLPGGFRVLFHHNGSSMSLWDLRNASWVARVAVRPPTPMLMWLLLGKPARFDYTQVPHAVIKLGSPAMGVVRRLLSGEAPLPIDAAMLARAASGTTDDLLDREIKTLWCIVDAQPVDADVAAAIRTVMIDLSNNPPSTAAGREEAKALITRQYDLLFEAQEARRRLDRWTDEPLADAEVARMRALADVTAVEQQAVAAMLATADAFALEEKGR